MISFRKFVLVGAMLAAFAGLAAAQTVQSLTVLPESYPTLRAEGLTETVPALDFNLNLTGPLLGDTGATANYDLYIYGKAGAPFTSPAANIVVSGGTSGTPLVTGAVVKIPNVKFSFAALAATSKVTVDGILIDANAIGPNSPLSFQIVAIPTSGGPTTLAPVAQNIDTVTVGTIAVSLTTTVSATADKPITGSTTANWTSPDFDPTETDVTKLPGAGLFSVWFTANYPGAFNTTLDTVAANPLRFTFTLTNLPTGLALYVPQTVPVSGGNRLDLVLGADANGLGGYLAPASVAAFAVPASGQVTYQLWKSDGSQPKYQIQVYSVGTTPLSVTSAAAPVTFVGSYAPLSSDISSSASAPILRFAKTSTTEFDSFIVVKLPSSHFVFPYVVSGGGWVTGIAVINGGAGWNSAANIMKGTAGTCKLTFFSADGTAVPPASVTVPLTGASIAAIPAGGNYGFTLDQAIGTGSYAGIVFGTCNFDNVKAFGYLNGAGTTAAYLAQ